MVRLTFNPFKLRTVAHYAYEYVAMHGDVVRGKFTHTKPEDAFRRGYKEAELKGRFPLLVRVVDEQGKIFNPPVVANKDEQGMADNPPHIKFSVRVVFTEQELIAALKDAQAAHHKHEAEELAKYKYYPGTPEYDGQAIELSNSWVEWYVAHIFKRKVADSAIEEIVGTL